MPKRDRERPEMPNDARWGWEANEGHDPTGKPQEDKGNPRGRREAKGSPGSPILPSVAQEDPRGDHSSKPWLQGCTPGWEFRGPAQR